MGKKVKKTKIALLSVIVLLIISFIIYNASKGSSEKKVEQSDSAFTINEEWWASKKQSRQSGTKEYQFESIKAGDVIYDKAGYKLIVKDVYEKEIVLKQEGGLVEANENGNLNAMASAKDTYTVKKGSDLKLKSYSLRSGIILDIKY